MSLLRLVHECDYCGGVRTYSILVMIMVDGKGFLVVGKHRRKFEFACVVGVLQSDSFQLSLKVPYSVLSASSTRSVAFFVTYIRIASGKPASLVHKYWSTAGAEKHGVQYLPTVQHADRKYPGCSNYSIWPMRFLWDCFWKDSSVEKNHVFLLQRTNAKPARARTTNKNLNFCLESIYREGDVLPENLN